MSDLITVVIGLITDHTSYIHLLPRDVFTHYIINYIRYHVGQIDAHKRIDGLVTYCHGIRKIEHIRFNRNGKLLLIGYETIESISNDRRYDQYICSERRGTIRGVLSDNRYVFINGSMMYLTDSPHMAVELCPAESQHICNVDNNDNIFILSSSKLQQFNKHGRHINTLALVNHPYSATSSKNGNIFIAYANYITYVRPNGEILHQTKGHYFTNIIKIIVDNDDNLLVIDQQRLTMFFLFDTQTETGDPPSLQFIQHYPDSSKHYNNIRDIAINSVGEIYILSNNVIQLRQRGDIFIIIVKTLDGASIPIFVTNHDPIIYIKWQIHMSEGIPPDQQRLIFKGKQLDNDDLTVLHCDIKPNSVLHQLIRLRGD